MAAPMHDGPAMSLAVGTGRSDDVVFLLPSPDVIFVSCLPFRLACRRTSSRIRVHTTSRQTTLPLSSSTQPDLGANLAPTRPVLAHSSVR